MRCGTLLAAHSIQQAAAEPSRKRGDVCDVQGPTGTRQRLTSDGGDLGTPNGRQLVDEAADMLSQLLSSPDKVSLLRKSSDLLLSIPCSAAPAASAGRGVCRHAE